MQNNGEMSSAYARAQALLNEETRNGNDMGETGFVGVISYDIEKQEKVERAMQKMERFVSDVVEEDAVNLYSMEALDLGGAEVDAFFNSSNDQLFTANKKNPEITTAILEKRGALEVAAKLPDADDFGLVEPVKIESIPLNDRNSKPATATNSRDDSLTAKGDRDVMRKKVSVQLSNQTQDEQSTEDLNVNRGEGKHVRDSYMNFRMNSKEGTVQPVDRTRAESSRGSSKPSFRERFSSVGPGIKSMTSGVSMNSRERSYSRTRSKIFRKPAREKSADSAGSREPRAKSVGAQPKASWKQTISQVQSNQLLALRTCPVPVVTDLEYKSVGSRTASDLFVFIHNGIRRDFSEIYLILNILSKRLGQLELHDIAAFYEWWSGTRTNLVEGLELREKFIFGALEERGSQLQFELSAPKRRARFSAMYRFVGAIDEMELAFVRRENDSVFVELVNAVNELRKLIVNDMQYCESEAVGLLESDFSGPELLRLETQFYAAMLRHSEAEILMPACIAWITEADVANVWETKHVRGLKKFRFRRMQKLYQSKHMAVASALADSRSASAPWFKR
uniref:Uncharacterized protein n=1 Tax=Timspurckia oligopyrenoides TaxID=708627 RepID=A0A7S0ZIV2_9RHOD|mmetsp:Transcript_6423/g.11434  ORF Transcript_6423/g.11434 Transcript_6423/m.11434 type:complete len:565 (+) Transcript_6423:85-1779(+)